MVCDSAQHKGSVLCVECIAGARRLSQLPVRERHYRRIAQVGRHLLGDIRELRLKGMSQPRRLTHEVAVGRALRTHHFAPEAAAQQALRIVHFVGLGWPEAREGHTRAALDGSPRGRDCRDHRLAVIGEPLPCEAERCKLLSVEREVEIHDTGRLHRQRRQRKGSRSARVAPVAAAICAAAAAATTVEMVEGGEGRREAAQLKNPLVSRACVHLYPSKAANVTAPMRKPAQRADAKQRAPECWAEERLKLEQRRTGHWVGVAPEVMRGGGEALAVKRDEERRLGPHVQRRGRDGAAQRRADRELQRGIRGPTPHCWCVAEPWW